METLEEMENQQWVTNNHPLYGLAGKLNDFDIIRDAHTVGMQNSDTASIKFGSMTLKVQKGREGRRQDYQAFGAFDLGGGERELCVMKVQGLALLSGPAGGPGAGAGPGANAGADGAAGAAVAAPGEMKIAYGVMATCTAGLGRGLEEEYDDGPAQGEPITEDGPVYKIPSMLLPQPVLDDGGVWYPYAMELKDVQCTVLEGKFEDGSLVFLPYLPMSSHG